MATHRIPSTLSATSSSTATLPQGPKTASERVKFGRFAVTERHFCCPRRARRQAKVSKPTGPHLGARTECGGPLPYRKPNYRARTAACRLQPRSHSHLCLVAFALHFIQADDEEMSCIMPGGPGALPGLQTSAILGAAIRPSLLRRRATHAGAVQVGDLQQGHCESMAVPERV